MRWRAWLQATGIATLQVLVSPTGHMQLRNTTLCHIIPSSRRGSLSQLEHGKTRRHTPRTDDLAQLPPWRCGDIDGVTDGAASATASAIPLHTTGHGAKGGDGGFFDPRLVFSIRNLKNKPGDC